MHSIDRSVGKEHAQRAVPTLADTPPERKSQSIFLSITWGVITVVWVVQSGRPVGGADLYKGDTRRKRQSMTAPGDWVNDGPTVRPVLGTTALSSGNPRVHSLIYRLLESRGGSGFVFDPRPPKPRHERSHTR